MYMCVCECECVYSICTYVYKYRIYGNGSCLTPVDQNYKNIIPIILSYIFEGIAERNTDIK